MNPINLIPTLRTNPAAPVYIVGAGISGCVLAERIVSLFDRLIVVLEKRPVVGGNSYADIDPRPAASSTVTARTSSTRRTGPAGITSGGPAPFVDASTRCR